ncbi:hypothetical protein O181_129567 [Austropuccinia psidii MF-1]|uniref:CCHC-type domain-containing protein n=1 Tax=Austropuccinia psidii MF-1 TaxID=1389203 RepID=A0A9Q3QBL2_9BASI|nr:hypothetical protein [Austropuccinia psidii MF-1]
MSGELEHAVKFRCKQRCTLDDNENELQDFQRETAFQGGLQRQTQSKNCRSDQEENTCHKCGSTDHYANKCPKAKKKGYAIEKVPEEDSPIEDSESESMGNAIIEQSDDDQDPREVFLVEYQEEKQIEIQDTQLEAGITQDTAKKNLCKHTQDAQTFLVTPTK